MPWTEKYAPQKVADVIGQKKAVDQFVIWLRSWRPGKKAALFHGSAGTGKTALVEALGKERNLEVIEMNASDFRTAQQIKEVIGQSMKQQSLFKKGKIFFIDEIDGLAGREDRGGTGEIIKIIKESQYPIILTANNPWDTKLRSLRAYCQLIQFGKVFYWDMIKRLQYICEKEKIKCDKEIITQIVRRSEGDLRSAINDLETLARDKKEITLKDLDSLGNREREMNIFDVLKIIFKTKTAMSAKLSIQNTDKDPEEIFLWIEQNIINEYEKSDEIAKAYEMLSRADLFMQRIKNRQEWKFEKYMIDLMTAGVALAKKEMYRKFSRYQYPDRMIFLGRSKVERKEDKEKLMKLSKQFHCSTKKIRKEFLPFL
ncbi:MAG: replication factor C large subunit, partial [Candidatus Aenigmarchaeota archaeon]|nr:replication factor C large subunit [Candidatus Aenigmarchaeota archaeon]